MSFVETMAIAGFPVRDDMTPSLLKELDEELAEHSRCHVIMCGSGNPEPICACGYVAEILCDWPMGDGKTCDLHLCPTCAHEIGEDKHACEIHWHEFQQRTGVQRMFPVLPHMVR